MPKHHEKKPHRKGVGVKLIGKPDELINLIIKDSEGRKVATEQVANEGPDHKQVHSALLLKHMYKLVQSIEKLTGVPFTVQVGKEIIAIRPEHEIKIPVPFPVDIANTHNAEIIKVLSHAPEHELIAFSILLQAIEWSIKTIPKKN